MRPVYKRRGLIPLEAGRRRRPTVAFGNSLAGLTLVELVLALLLLSVVILTGISMELGMRRIFSSADTEAQLLQEAAPIMALVTKVINRGIGQDATIPSDPPIQGMMTSFESRFCIRVDSNNNGMADANDIWVYFQFIRNIGGIKHQLRYYPDNASASYQLLSQRVIFFHITYPAADGVSNITLTLRKDPDNPVNLTNPEVTVQTYAQYREFSLS